MLPDWLYEKLIDGDITEVQCFWVAAAFATFLWSLQYVKPALVKYRSWRDSRNP